jgi:hypothetical protein
MNITEFLLILPRADEEQAYYKRRQETPQDYFRAEKPCKSLWEGREVPFFVLQRLAASLGAAAVTCFRERLGNAAGRRVFHWASLPARWAVALADSLAVAVAEPPQSMLSCSGHPSDDPLGPPIRTHSPPLSRRLAPPPLPSFPCRARLGSLFPLPPSPSRSSPQSHTELDILWLFDDPFLFPIPLRMFFLPLPIVTLPPV